MEHKREIKNFTREALVEWFEQMGEKSFRAGQIFKWLYLRQANSFDEMTDIGKELRETLKENFSISRLALERSERSKDGTEKLLFRLQDNAYIEAVLIPEKDHYTLCISTQVGCAQACKFCLTAKGGFERNLTTAEIVDQVRDAKALVVARDSAKPMSNIVFMGMGEPLANYDAVVKALSIITDSDYGLKFSSRRVTVSTSGLVPEILALGNETEVNLAVSLNATTEETRSMLMPINRRYPMEELLKACKSFEMKPRKKITFEYILIQGINDSDEDAMRLITLLRPIRSKVNIIPFNEHDKSNFKRPPKERIQRFLQILLDRNVTAMVRKSKGDDISAACGQLRAKNH
ncbi:MAG: 23S rRNA (adenine(2503)-C(2))-methyltransferase RlmN [Desulfobacterium sp.]|nr:23S rRNA (adenine(2503)-C(2))-methyltransferase RlmN [Desulfobacterium sp.]